MDWDDLRLLCALAHERTVAATAIRLSIDQSTVTRRCRGLEKSLGATLLERAGGEIKFTQVGQRVLDHALSVESRVANLLRTVEGVTHEIAGEVRITAVASISSEYLAGRLDDLYRRYPDIAVELLSSNANLDISRREADIAIRLGRPSQGDLVVRRIAKVGFAIYESADPHLVPSGDDWVSFDTHLRHIPEVQWLNDRGGQPRIRLRASDTRTLCAGVAGGVGRGVLSIVTGDGHPGIRRVSEPLFSRDLWLVMHAKARETRRVAAVADWLVERFTSDARLFHGRDEETCAPPCAD